MSRWADRVRDHRIWAQLEGLGSAIERAREKGADAIDVHEAVTRLSAVATFVGGRLASIDRELVAPAPLDALATTIERVTDYLNRFGSSADASELAQANTEADVALQQVGSLASPYTSSDLESALRQADRYSEAVRSLMAKLQSRASEVEESLSVVDKKVADLDDRAMRLAERNEETVNTWQGQFSTAQDARSREHTQAESTRNKEFADLLVELQDRVRHELDAVKSTMNDMTDLSRQELLDLSIKTQKSAADTLAEITGVKTRVETLAGVIGNVGVTSGYVLRANEARRAIRVWQGITVGALVVLGGIALAFAVGLLHSPPTTNATEIWASLGTRALVSVALGLVAAYSSAQADKYLEIERRSRKLALELEALGPFLSGLDAAKQEEFKIDVGQRTFGRDDQPLAVTSKRSPATLLDLILRNENGLKELKEFIKLLKD